MQEPNGKIQICGMTNLKSNERTIQIDLFREGETTPFLRVQVDPKSFGETLTTHIARPAFIEG